MIQHACLPPLDVCFFVVVSRGSTAEVATQNIIDVQIPALKDLCNSGSLSIDNIDVFCEKGVFDTDASRRILRAGQEAGWKINFHGDELHPMNSGEVRGIDQCIDSSNHINLLHLSS